MKSGRRTIATTAACMLATCAGANAAPIFTTVVDGDFGRVIGSSSKARWWTQVGSGGHVAYFASDELRLWDGSQTTVLHTVGTQLDGLRTEFPTRTASHIGMWGEPGRIVGVDRHGGLSALLTTDPPPTESVGTVLASTTPSGFRAVMAHPDVSDGSPGAPVRATTMPLLGIIRNDSGHTISGGVLRIAPGLSELSKWAFAPDGQASLLFKSGDSVPGIGTETRSPNVTSFSTDAYGLTLNSHIASDGGAAFDFQYTIPGEPATHAGVLRVRDGETDVIARSDTDLSGVRFAANTRPLVRTNAAGDVLVSGRMTIDGVESLNALIVVNPDTQSREVIARRGDTLTFSNFRDAEYSPAGSSFIQHSIQFADDGSILFTPGDGVITAHRSPGGELRVLFDVMGGTLGLAPGMNAAPTSPFFHSLDATSAAATYRVGNNSLITIFHATPDATTRIIGVNDTFEVAPGDVRQVSAVELLDVNGPLVLLHAEFTDNSMGMFLAEVPACPADLNGDGVVDADDFFLFLQWFAAGDPRADINNDGVIDADDFFDYLDLFVQGC